MAPVGTAIKVCVKRNGHTIMSHDSSRAGTKSRVRGEQQNYRTLKPESRSHTITQADWVESSCARYK
jgi:hypothetical protein